MPRTRSAMKALRVSERRHLRNRSVRSALRTHVKKARTTVESGGLAEAPGLVKLAVSQLDKAASKGIIHRRQAARRKSRLMRRLAAVGGAAEIAIPVAEEAPAPTRARRTSTPRATSTTTRTRAAGTTDTGAATTRSRSAASGGATAARSTSPRRQSAASGGEGEAQPPRPTRTRRTPPSE